MIEWCRSSEPLRSSVYRSPLGLMRVLYADDAVARADFSEGPPATPRIGVEDAGMLPNWVYDLFEAAFSGSILPSWRAIDWGYSPMERAMLSRASEVPFGTTMSYGNLAAWSGFVGRARAAGRAMGRSSVAYLIPTHRVIRADGTPSDAQRDPLNAALRRYEGIELSSRRAMMGTT